MQVQRQFTTKKVVQPIKASDGIRSRSRYVASWLIASCCPTGISRHKGRQTHETMITGGSLALGLVALSLVTAWFNICEVVYAYHCAPFAVDYSSVGQHTFFSTTFAFIAYSTWILNDRYLRITITIVRIQRNLLIMNLLRPWLEYQFYLAELPSYRSWYDCIDYNYFTPMYNCAPTISNCMQVFFYNYLEDLLASTVNGLQNGLDVTRPIKTHGHGDYHHGTEEIFITDMQRGESSESGDELNSEGSSRL